MDIWYPAHDAVKNPNTECGLVHSTLHCVLCFHLRKQAEQIMCCRKLEKFCNKYAWMYRY